MGTTSSNCEKRLLRGSNPFPRASIIVALLPSACTDVGGVLFMYLNRELHGSPKFWLFHLSRIRHVLLCSNSTKPSYPPFLPENEFFWLSHHRQRCFPSHVYLINMLCEGFVSNGWNSGDITFFDFLACPTKSSLFHWGLTEDTSKVEVSFWWRSLILYSSAISLSLIGAPRRDCRAPQKPRKLKKKEVKVKTSQSVFCLRCR